MIAAGYDARWLTQVRADAGYRWEIRTPVAPPKYVPKHRGRRPKTDKLVVALILVVAFVGVDIGWVGAITTGPAVHMGTPKPVHVTWPVRSRTTHLREA